MADQVQQAFAKLQEANDFIADCNVLLEQANQIFVLTAQQFEELSDEQRDQWHRIPAHLNELADRVPVLRQELFDSWVEEIDQTEADNFNNAMYQLEESGQLLRDLRNMAKSVGHHLSRIDIRFWGRAIATQPKKLGFLSHYLTSKQPRPKVDQLALERKDDDISGELSDVPQPQSYFAKAAQSKPLEKELANVRSFFETKFKNYQSDVALAHQYLQAVALGSDPFGQLRRDYLYGGHRRFNMLLYDIEDLCLRLRTFMDRFDVIRGHLNRLVSDFGVRALREVREFGSALEEARHYNQLIVANADRIAAIGDLLNRLERVTEEIRYYQAFREVFITR